MMSERDKLAEQVKAAQDEYMRFVLNGTRKTAAGRQAEARRDSLEAELIQMDTAAQLGGEVPVSPRFTALCQRETELRVALALASNGRNPGSVFRIMSQLESLWREKDAHNWL